MRLLLDTHALLWLLADDPRLESDAREAITDPANAIFVSAASLWEIALKLRIGKLTATLSDIIAGYQETGIQRLDISDQHILTLAQIPQIPSHKDPFDHLIIAQALCDGLTLVSEDRHMLRYPIALMRCSNGLSYPS